MEIFKNFFCSIVGIVGSIFVNIVGGWDSALATLTICMVLDYLTGLTVAGVFKNSTKTETGTLQSQVGLKGLCKKIMMVAFVAVAYRLDKMLGVNYIRYTVVIGFVCNEVISLIENAGLMGLPIPNVIVRAVDILKQKSNGEEE